jgi:hypothetical protein
MSYIRTLAATLKIDLARMKRLIKCFVLLVPLGFYESYGQTTQPSTTTIRSEIQKIVKGIAKDNVLKGEAVGYAGTRTDQWDRYEKLKKDATNTELLTLTDNHNAVVRCYAFQALATKKEIDVFPVVLKHLSDTSTIETFFGCIVSSQTVGDYFVEVVTPEYIDLDAYKLTARQRTTIDSALLFDKSIRISAKYILLSKPKPNPNFYHRIREIAVTENSPVAILALSRFQNENDIGIIKTLFENENTEYYAAYSAREFPNNLFYPYLTKIFEKEWSEKYYDYPKWRILYQALAKYPTSQTYQLFERTTKTTDDFRYQTLGKYLTIAITKYPNKIFEPLKERITLDEYHSNEVKNEIDIEK